MIRPVRPIRGGGNHPGRLLLVCKSGKYGGGLSLIAAAPGSEPGPPGRCIRIRDGSGAAIAKPAQHRLLADNWHIALERRRLCRGQSINVSRLGMIAVPVKPVS